MEKRTDIQIILELSSNKSVKEIKSRKKNVTKCYKILWDKYTLVLEVFDNGAGKLTYPPRQKPYQDTSYSFFDKDGSWIKRDTKEQEEKYFKSLFK